MPLGPQTLGREADRQTLSGEGCSHRWGSAAGSDREVLEVVSSLGVPEGEARCWVHGKHRPG